MKAKDYNRIAHILNICESKHTIIMNLASTFEAYNPKFDRDKFLQACGIEVSDVR